MNDMNILDVADIVSNSVQPYLGEKLYLDTGNLEIDSYLTSKLSSYSYDEKPSRANLELGIGNIAIAKMKDTVKVLIVDDKSKNFLFSTGFLGLSPKKDLLDSKYLFYYLKSDYFQIKKNQLSTGATQKAINNTNFKKIKIPLPSLDKQKQIVEILDQVEEIKRKREETISKLEMLKKSIFFDMFGDPVKNNKKWKVRNLGEMLEFITSGSRGWARYYSNVGSLFLTIKNVGRNKLILDEKTYVNAPESAESRRTRVKLGDILLSITADLGRTAVIETDLGKAHINQHLAILRLKDKYSPVYVSEYLSSTGGKFQIEKRVKGASKDGLNFNDIQSLKILTPPLDIQKWYAEHRNTILNTEIHYRKSLRKLDYLSRSLVQKAFKGKLLPN